MLHILIIINNNNIVEQTKFVWRAGCVMIGTVAAAAAATFEETSGPVSWRAAFKNATVAPEHAHARVRDTRHVYIYYYASPRSFRDRENRVASGAEGFSAFFSNPRRLLRQLT